MNIGKAVAIFKNIRSDKYAIDEKGCAIYHVCKMPTHNGITKKDMIDVLRWLFMVV